MSLSGARESLGLAGGVLLAALAIAWPGLWSLALCLLIAAVAGSAFAAATGAFVPVLLRLWPARAWMPAGPIARVLAGIVTLWIYFLFARFLVR
jgi:hypothetical protein